MRKWFIGLTFYIGLGGLQAQKRIHVFVALCDNTYQGIVKVPAKIGNGQDAANNLYWGAMYGVKTVFSRDAAWENVPIHGPAIPEILQQKLFRHKASGTLMLAEAWDGRSMEACLKAYFESAAGSYTRAVEGKEGKAEQFGGKSDLVVFVGHNGLMDFTPQWELQAVQGPKPQTMAFCCYSNSYFSPTLRTLNEGGLRVSTYGLMAPEAYLLQAVLKAWIAGQNAVAQREAAAVAYNHYQKCGLNAARRLFGVQQ
jgi:hypothetical protein